MAGKQWKTKNNGRISRTEVENKEQWRRISRTEVENKEQWRNQSDRSEKQRTMEKSVGQKWKTKNNGRISQVENKEQWKDPSGRQWKTKNNGRIRRTEKRNLELNSCDCKARGETTLWGQGPPQPLNYLPYVSRRDSCCACRYRYGYFISPGPYDEEHVLVLLYCHRLSLS